MKDEVKEMLDSDNILVIHDDVDLGIWIDFSGQYYENAKMTLIVQECDKEDRAIPIHINVRELVQHLVKQL